MTKLTVDAEALRNCVFAIETNLPFITKRLRPDAPEALEAIDSVKRSLERMKELLKDQE